MSSFPALCSQPHRNLPSLQAPSCITTYNSLYPLIPGKIVFLMETGTTPWFMCYFISPLFFDEYRLMVV